jgi:VWFA-related protein
LVSADGFVFTNAHVVEGCRRMTAVQIRGDLRRPYNAVLKLYDKKRDTAVLKIEGQGFDHFDLLSRNAHIGERVYAIGNPMGLEQTITAGIISGLRPVDGTLLIQHSAPISHGSSGGALISSRGELLGINSFFLRESQGLNFAIPASAMASAYSDARGIPGVVRFPNPAPTAGPSEADPREDRPLPSPPVISRPPADPKVPGATERLIRLNVTVSDGAGRRLKDLTQSAFTVLENDVPQHIKTFGTEDTPVSMGVVINNSNTMHGKLADASAVAMDLVETSNREDEYFVVNFNDEAFLDNPHGKDFTSNIKEIEEALTRIDSRGGSAMRDAIRMSIDHLKEKSHKDKKVLVVVTDGNDNSSVISLENLVKSAQLSEVSIYVIGLLGGEDRREAGRAKRALEDLAMATGGEAFFPKDRSEANHSAEDVARDIRGQYTIVYSPSNAAMDGSWRRIRVMVKAPGHPIARTRLAYCATKGGL